MKLCSTLNCSEKHRAGGLCKKHYNLYWRTKFPEKMKQSKQKWNSSNREHIKKYKKEKRRANLSIFKEKRKQNYQKNKTNELLQNKEWRKNNPERVKELKNRWAKTTSGRKYLLKRRNLRIQQLKKRTPPWVDVNEIKHIYNNRPDGYHVDHIIPLNGINVSGLHVPWNLQYLPSKVNINKGNKV
jgi:hypothetical protein